MADISTPTGHVALFGEVAGKAPATFAGAEGVYLYGQSVRDLRHLTPTQGSITDQVVLKTAGGEVPFVNGRVWLLRLADGFKAWEGWSDAAGTYTATGLEVGVEYVALAIDPTKQHKTTGAGPVVAA